MMRVRATKFDDFVPEVKFKEELFFKVVRDKRRVRCDVREK